MSRIFRSVATALLISLLACSSLPALPFAAGMPSSDADRGNVLTELIEWIGSIFTGRADSMAPDSAHPKEGSIMDPDGNH